MSGLNVSPEIERLIALLAKLPGLGPRSARRATLDLLKNHILGGTLSALDGIRPEDLNIASLIERASEPDVKEVILAMNATVDGQTTAHYITDHLSKAEVQVSRLAHGVPVGGELDYLDDGTISAAMKSRRPF